MERENMPELRTFIGCNRNYIFNKKGKKYCSVCKTELRTTDEIMYHERTPVKDALPVSWVYGENDEYRITARPQCTKGNIATNGNLHKCLRQSALIYRINAKTKQKFRNRTVKIQPYEVLEGLKQGSVRILEPQEFDNFYGILNEYWDYLEILRKVIVLDIVRIPLKLENWIRE